MRIANVSDEEGGAKIEDKSEDAAAKFEVTLVFEGNLFVKVCYDFVQFFLNRGFV